MKALTVKLPNIWGFEKFKALPKLLRITFSKLFDMAKKLTPLPIQIPLWGWQRNTEKKYLQVCTGFTLLVNAVLQMSQHLHNSMQHNRWVKNNFFYGLFTLLRRKVIFLCHWKWIFFLITKLASSRAYRKFIILAYVNWYVCQAFFSCAGARSRQDLKLVSHPKTRKEKKLYFK